MRQAHFNDRERSRARKRLRENQERERFANFSESEAEVFYQAQKVASMSFVDEASGEGEEDRGWELLGRPA